MPYQKFITTLSKQAYTLFQKMKPDKVAYHSLLNRCTNTSFILTNLYPSNKDKNGNIMNALHIMNHSYNDVIQKYKYILNDNYYHMLFKGFYHFISDDIKKVDVVRKYIT